MASVKFKKLTMIRLFHQIIKDMDDNYRISYWVGNVVTPLAVSSSHA